MKYHVTKGSVIDDLDLSEEEARNLKIRSLLMRTLEDQIKQHGWTQTQAAKELALTKPVVSDLMHGRIESFTIDTLIGVLWKCGVPVSLVIDDRLSL